MSDWTDEERVVVAEIYEAGRPMPWHLLPHRTPASIAHEARRCGLVKETRAKWTADDIEVLRQMYATWPPCYDLMSERPREHIYSKAYREGLTNRVTVDSGLGDVTESEWAYFAGIIEGEGTIHLAGPRKKAGGRVDIIVCNSDMDLIQWMDETFPGACRTDYARRAGVTFGNYTYASGTESKMYIQTKDLARIQWSRRRLVRDMLIQLLPHFRGVRKPRAEAALAFLEEALA